MASNGRLCCRNWFLIHSAPSTTATLPSALSSPTRTASRRVNSPAISQSPRVTDTRRCSQVSSYKATISNSLAGQARAFFGSRQRLTHFLLDQQRDPLVVAGLGAADAKRQRHLALDVHHQVQFVAEPL